MVFFIFSKLYLMIFPSSAAYLALSTLKNRQIVVLQKSWRKWRKIFELLLLLKWPLWEQEMFTVPCILKYSHICCILLLSTAYIKLGRSWGGSIFLHWRGRECVCQQSQRSQIRWKCNKPSPQFNVWKQELE